jgi:hypothetical protein
VLGDPAVSAPDLQVQFCGEWTTIAGDRPFFIGRDADLVIDENPYLHRRFLELRFDQLWWLANVGDQLSATVSDADGGVQAWLAPGARLPVVFGTMLVRFTAGPTRYELSVHLDDPPLAVTVTERHESGTTTVGRVTLTQPQRLLVLALAEPALRDVAGGSAPLPSSAEAAARLGWPITQFNRTLDRVCAKLARNGVQGLHGGPDRLASNRRARLVEYALAVRLVTPEELILLDRPPSAD